MISIINDKGLRFSHRYKSVIKIELLNIIINSKS